MILPRGISGFHSYKEPELPTVDYGLFKKSCYEVARVSGGKMELHRPPNFETNFFTLGIQSPSEHVWVLCNRYFPYVSIAKPFEDNSNITFVDSQLLKRFEEIDPNWIPVSPAEAQSPLISGVVDTLGDTELEQLEYWNPKTVGEIIYNFWD